MEKRCIAYGDCNTEGLKGSTIPLWPELVAAQLEMALTNCGHTMSTTREMSEYARSHPAAGTALGMIQYGLVDSWLTFRGAPYVLYYPDRPLRKVARRVVKKLKKMARTLKLQQRIGAVEQVPVEEYIQRIRAVVRSAPDTLFALVATAPNLDEPRNPRIQRYNSALAALAADEPNAFYVDTYDSLWGSRAESLMEDGTHLTAAGHRLVADAVVREYLAVTAGIDKEAAPE